MECKVPPESWLWGLMLGSTQAGRIHIGTEKTGGWHLSLPGEVTEEPPGPSVELIINHLVNVATYECGTVHLFVVVLHFARSSIPGFGDGTI